MKKFYALLLATLVAMSAMAARPELKSRLSEAQQRARLNIVEKMMAPAKHQFRNTMSTASAARFKAPVKAEADIIFAPEGESVAYKNHAMGYANSMFGVFYMEGNNPSEVVWGEDGDVYIRDICSFLSSGVYVKGKYADGKVTVELPQICYYEPEDEEYEEFSAYATVCEFYEFEEDGELYYGYRAAPEDKCTITYSVGEDRSLTLELNDPTMAYDPDYVPEYIIGMVDDPTPGVETWYGFGDAYQELGVFDDEPVEVPEGVEFESWAVIANNATSLCEVGFDGDDVYVRGAFSSMPDAVFKGEVQDDKVVVPCNQYLGMYMGYYIYLNAVEWVDESWEEFTMLDELVLDYDAEAKMIAVNNDMVDVLFNTTTDDYDPYYYLENPTFRYQSEEDTNAAPEDPYVIHFEAYAAHSWGDEGYIEWVIPNINVNGFLLPTDRIYYHLLANDEVLTLTTDDYPEFDKDYTDIPWEYGDDWDLQVSDDSRYFTFKNPDFTTFGCQSFYVGANGETYASNLVTYEPVGIEGVTALKEIKTVEFYDLQGRRVINPAKGLYIVRYKYTDGSSAVSKVVK